MNKWLTKLSGLFTGIVLLLGQAQSIVMMIPKRIQNTRSSWPRSE